MFLLAVCHALNQARVDYAVVGGYAVALHGAVRGTVDLDLVVRLTMASFQAVESVIQSLGLMPRLPVNATHVFQFREEYIENRNLIAWSFYDPSNPANQLDIIITEDLSTMTTDRIHVKGTLVRLLSKKDLIAMKSRSGRPQDLEDIRALTALSRS